MGIARPGIGLGVMAGCGLAIAIIGGMEAVTLTASPGTSPLLIIGMAVAAQAAMAATAWWTLRSLRRGLNDAIATARRIADGDLAQDVPLDHGGEFGELLQGLHDISERLFSVVSQVRTGTTAVATASGMITNDNAALASRTEEQSASLEETASSIEELTSTVAQNAENAEQANSLAVAAAESAVQGGRVVDNVVTTMHAIQDSARKVTDIISVIDGIAFQTNILALNAAVEAARAGEQGRGFAVVASEVRTLAQRSANAAQEIKTLITDSVAKTNAGGELVNQAGESMAEIVKSVKHLADIMGEITAASKEQRSGIEEINQAVTQIDTVTQKNGALVEDISKGVAHLHEQAVHLTEAVAIFRLGVREFGNADEAVAMVRRGVEFGRSHGESVLISEVNKLTKGRFIDRDLYLSIYSLDCIALAHGANPRLIGIDGKTFKDVDGKFFVKDIVSSAKTKGSGWIDYKWAHPVTKKMLVKTSYFEVIGNVVVACGFYK
jgi:methyl-accepting chemotaxis protein